MKFLNNDNFFKMKKNTILLLFLLANNFLFAQKITSQVIDASGGTHRANGYTLTYSVGQIAVETLKSNNYIITQGFQQVEKNNTIGSKENTQNIDFQAIVFPNPTQDILNIKIENDENDGFEIVLFNLSGQQLSQGSFSEKNYQIEVSHLPVGEYILKLKNSKSQKMMVSKFLKM